MTLSRLAPFALRARPRLTLILPALALTLVVGCSHKRTSMRPVYVRPAPCPSGDCGSTVVPSSPATLGPAATAPSMPMDEPSLSTSTTTSTLPSGPIKSMPSDNGNSPPAVTPPVPGFPDEPDLTPASGPVDSSKVAPMNGTDKKSGSGSGGSGSLKSSSVRPAASARPRQASLSDQVRPFVNDADDLITPPKADRPWQYIVLHHSANETGGYDSIDREHRKRLGWNGCGYHFVIGNGSETPDGKIEVSQRWINQKHGVHCRDGKNPDANEYGIGICLVGDLEKTPPTPKQIASARALVAYLRNRYHIAADHTETHAHLASTAISCPGKMFPVERILNTSGMALLPEEHIADR